MGWRKKTRSVVQCATTNRTSSGCPYLVPGIYVYVTYVFFLNGPDVAFRRRPGSTNVGSTNSGCAAMVQHLPGIYTSSRPATSPPVLFYIGINVQTVLYRGYYGISGGGGRHPLFYLCRNLCGKKLCRI